MNTEQKDFLIQAEFTLLDQIQNLRNQSNESLEGGAQYCFVLCNAKINFLTSILGSVTFALSGAAPAEVVNATVEAVKHVEETFSTFLGTACDI